MPIDYNVTYTTNSKEYVERLKNNKDVSDITFQETVALSSDEEVPRELADWLLETKGKFARYIRHERS